MPTLLRGELLRQYGTKLATENALMDLVFSVYTHGVHDTSQTPVSVQQRLCLFGECTGILQQGALIVHHGVMPDEIEALQEWPDDKEDLFFALLTRAALPADQAPAATLHASLTTPFFSLTPLCSRLRRRRRACCASRRWSSCVSTRRWPI
jgi:hypothetical protein